MVQASTIQFLKSIRQFSSVFYSQTLPFCKHNQFIIFWKISIYVLFLELEYAKSNSSTYYINYRK